MPKVGFKHSDETKEKLRMASTGNPGYWLGKKRGEEFSEKMRLANLGKKQSEETRRKRSEAMKGEKHHNWKGGATLLGEQIRKCFKYRQWRSDVFTRDDFSCVICGKRGGWIEADHYPKGFSEIFHKNNIKTIEMAFECEEFWDINNGRTLCLGCHEKTKNHFFRKGRNV